jgi:phosphomethylpyrimidine synthase
MEPMGIERHRWASREAEMSGSERVNTTLSGSGRVDDIQGHPQGEIRGLTKLVKITEDVRKYAAEHGLTDAEAIESGMQEKRKEFLESGAEVYVNG